MKYDREVKNENRSPEVFIIVARIVVNGFNTLFGALAAFSYSGPMLRRFEINLAQKALHRRAIANGLGATAEVMAARVGLLRIVAWGSGIGWAITIGEIGYRVYVSLQANKLEIWCTRCVFRQKSQNGKPYPNEDEELGDHAEARGLVGV